MLRLRLSKILIMGALICLNMNYASANESSCLSNNFNMKISDDVALVDVLNQLSEMCNLVLLQRILIAKQS